MNVVWDLGAVLLRWRPALLLARKLPRRVRDEADALRWSRAFFNDGGDWHAFDRGVVTVPELIERIARRLQLHHDEVQAVVDAVPHELQPIADNVSLLQRLHAAGHSQYYLSNMPAPYASHLLAAHGFFGRFERGVFSSHVQAIKPEPAIFAIAERTFGLGREGAVYIDDMAVNVEAAAAMGWTGVHYTGTQALVRDVERLGLV